MKDYEQLYRACCILDKYTTRKSNFNLTAEHDTVHLCFDVQPEELSKEDRQELAKLGCTYSNINATWQMDVSC